MWHTRHLVSSRKESWSKKVLVAPNLVNRIISFLCFSREKEISQLPEEDRLQELRAGTAEAM